MKFGGGRKFWGLVQYLAVVAGAHNQHLSPDQQLLPQLLPAHPSQRWAGVQHLQWSDVAA